MRLVLLDGFRKQVHRRRDVPPRRGDEAAAAGDVRQRPGAIEPPRSSLPRVQTDDRIVHEAELEQRLDLLGPPQLHRRFRTVGRVRHLLRRPEAVDGCGRSPAPELDDPERRQRAVQADSVELRQPAASPGRAREHAGGRRGGRR